MDNALKTPDRGPAVTRNYSLTLAHIAKVSDLAVRTGLSQGEIVRQAIDLLYEQMESQDAIKNASATERGA